MGLSSSKDTREQRQVLSFIELNQDGQLDEFLRAHPGLANSKLCNDSTNTMCRASFLGYKNIVVILVKHGANVN